MADHSIRIGIDSSGAEAGANRVSRSLRQIARDAVQAVGKGIKIGIDGSSVDAGAAKVKKSLRDILTQSGNLKAIRVGLDASGVQAGAGAISKSLRDIQQQTSALTNKKVSVKFDAAGLQEGVDRASLSLRQLSDQAESRPIKVKIDAAAVEAAVTKASQSLRDLSGQGSGVQIKVDTAAAEASTQRLRRSLGEIGGAAANVSIKVDSSVAEAGASRVKGSLRDIVEQAAKVSRLPINMDVSGVQASASTVKKSLRDIQDEARKTSTGMTALAGVGSSIKGAFGSIAAAFGAVEVSKQIFDITAKTQDLQTRFETLTGSAEGATETMKFLSDASNRLSVDTVKLADSYSKLLPMVKDGVLTTQEARDMMIGLTDAQKATGATTAQLEQAMFGLAQTLAMPKANIEQLNQVTEPIPGLLGAMDRAVGKLYPSTKKGAGAMRELVEAGKVTSQVFRDITIKALQEFDGAAEKTSGNLYAQTQRMKNAWNSLLNTIGQAVDEPLSWLIDKITLGIDAIENGIKRLTSLTGSLKESFDWTAPIASIQKAWSSAQSANPSPLATKPGPTPSTTKPTTTTKPATLGTGGSGGGGRSTGDRFAEQKREIEAQIAAQQGLVDAYERGMPAIADYQNSIASLSAEQRLNSGYSKEQSEALAELMAQLRGLDQAASVKSHIGTMTDEIQKIQGLAEAHMEGAEAVRHVEAANNAYSEALQRGVAHQPDVLASFMDLEVAAQKAGAALAVAEDLIQMDVDVSSVQRLVDAYSQGGSAVRNAAIETEVYARALKAGVEGEEEQVAAIRAKVTALHDVQAAQAAAQGTFNRDIDIEQMEGELRLSTMVGEARYIESERISMLADKKRTLQDATATLTAEEERQAESLGRLNYQMQAQTSEIQRLATSIPSISAAFDQAVTGGALHLEDALVDIVTGAKSAREAFADMAKSIANDLARMAIRMAIIQPLMSLFGGGMGSAPVFSGFTTAAAVGPINWAPVAHTGGIIGSDSLPMRSLASFHTGGVVGTETPGRRSLPALGDWNRYHGGGLASNEVPAVLQRGEGVFTKAQMAALAPANSNGGVSPTYNINVSVAQNQNGDPAAAERQGKVIAQQVEQAMNEHARRNLRPGGIFNPSGY